MPAILGRVTTDTGLPRGPDVVHRIGVPAHWIEQGYTIELELPRNLACAGCDGGGCDACGRAGAITLRGRKEPPELVEVTLPLQAPDGDPPSSGSRGVMLRVPGHGGFSEDDRQLPRGNLLLRVVPADEPDPGVRHARPTERPPAQEQPQPGEGAASDRLGRRAPILVAVVILWILFLIFLRMAGLL